MIYTHSPETSRTSTFRSSGLKELSDTVPTQNVVDFDVCTLSFEGHIERILQWASDGLSKVVCVANVHMLMEGHWHTDFAAVLDKADMITPDGMPLAWMVRLLKLSNQDRVAGMDILTGLCERSKHQPVSLFFLGSQPKTLSRIRSRINAQYPNVRIAGMVSPPFRAMTSDEDRAIIEQINNSKAGIVLVSFGCPKQERWMYYHKGKVNAVMIGLGGAFSVFAGEVRWAPRFVRNLGLEWLYRLVQEPRRLSRRYISTIPPFLYLALKQVVAGNR
ncbi:WecB/TagA/CpsF family glycosyltransferase [cf. Phormidesmis sp. LEGE 11477]|uniref:WecB/TagA/CpsF family glycosyltransferase n=1 Tax=cf. Phormidesmis sp. LEGE 11477 TaxID=1828680 RepID=UPI00187DF7AB|nr:WecB/TagA/CpsF family glycosyltransferase [cf. Phormidesmis sp. LEGE 11477]MBE9061242.1 WecB/TagA/CpsF family glycosyltransferase [cf. Phormidesmis sp. LEGE 11477]